MVYGPRWDAGGVVRAVETDSAYEDSEYAEDTCERDALDLFDRDCRPLVALVLPAIPQPQGRNGERGNRNRLTKRDPARSTLGFAAGIAHRRIS